MSLCPADAAPSFLVLLLPGVPLRPHLLLAQDKHIHHSCNTQRIIDQLLSRDAVFGSSRKQEADGGAGEQLQTNQTEANQDSG